MNMNLLLLLAGVSASLVTRATGSCVWNETHVLPHREEAAAEMYVNINMYY